MLTLRQGFLASHVNKLGVHKKLGGNTTRTADMHWPKKYSITYNVMVNKESWGIWPRRAAIAQGLAGHCLAGGEQWDCESLAFHYYYYYYYHYYYLFDWFSFIFAPFFPFLLNCPYLSLWVIALYPFFCSPPPSYWGGVNELLCGA